MGLFNWLERKIDPVGAFKRKPEVQQAMLAMEMEYAQKQADNLRAVGREDDAKRVTTEYLDKLFKEWKQKPDDPFSLVRLSHAAIQLKELETGKRLLEAVIEGTRDKPIFDLTPIYFELGRLYHFLQVDPDKELKCYQMGIAAQAPLKAKYIASQRMKAKMHLFAAGPANRLMNFDLHDQHMDECRKLVPDVNFDDMDAKIKFVQETQR